MLQDLFYLFKFWSAYFCVLIYGKILIKLCFQECSTNLMFKVLLFLFMVYTFCCFIIQNLKIKKWNLYLIEKLYLISI
jgi:succinate-acetate transporter protein